MVFLGAIGWSAFRRQPLRVEIVLGERVEDRVFQTAARAATASLRDALWRVGRNGQYRLEVVPPRQALCDGISAARCFQLLPTVRPAHRVVVTPVRPMEGGYLVELRAAGFGPSGQQLFDAHVAEPPDRAEKLSAELLSAVLNGFGMDVDASTQRRALMSPDQKQAYALLRASLAGSVVDLDDRVPATVAGGVRDAIWRARSDSDQRGTASHFLDWYAAALSAGSIGELSSVQPEMSNE